MTATANGENPGKQAMFITRRNFGEKIRITDSEGNTATIQVAYIDENSIELHVDDRDRHFIFDKRPRRGFPGQPAYPFRPRLNFAVDPNDPPPLPESDR